MKYALLLLLVACGDDRQAPPPARRDGGTAIVQTVTPDAAPLSGIRFVGVIAAADTVDVAPRFQGVLATVKVRPGDHVTAGQVIAEMDPKAMQEELRAAQAAFGAAQAAKRQADVDVEDARRKAKLEAQSAAQGISSRAVAEEAELAVKRAEAAQQRTVAMLAAETSHVETARDHLADNVLRAKSDGVVANRFKDPGSTVAAGTPIVRIVGRGGPRLKFAVPPELAHALEGKTVTATVDTITHPVTATVQQVPPSLDPASGMIIVEVEITGETADLRPGLAATVSGN